MIETMKLVGYQIHHTSGCINLWGLSITSTAQKIEALLHQIPPVYFKSAKTGANTS